MCPIKNLLSKRSTKSLHAQHLLSPFPPNVISPNYVSQEELNREPKRRDSVRVLPPHHSLPLRPISLVDTSPFSAPALLLHLPRSIYRKRTLRRSTQNLSDCTIIVEGAGANVVVPAQGRG